MDLHEVHLPGGRVARFRMLSASECDRVADAAALEISPEATNLAFNRARQRAGANAMLVSLTKNVVPIALEETTRIAMLEQLVAEVTRGIDAAAEAEAFLGAIRSKVVGSVSTRSYVVDEAMFERWNPGQYEETFGPKDDEVLRMLFSRYHEASVAEVGAVLGKVRMVTT